MLDSSVFDSINTNKLLLNFNTSINFIVYFKGCGGDGRGECSHLVSNPILEEEEFSPSFAEERESFNYDDDQYLVPQESTGLKRINKI